MLRKQIQIIIVAALFIPGSTSATPGIMKHFTAHYPQSENSQLASCRTCHMPVVEDCLNSYAISLRDNSLDFAAVENQDADGDGVSNIEEIREKKLPGSQAQKDEIFIFTNRIGTVIFNHEKHSLAREYMSEGRCANCHSEDAFPRKFDDTLSWQPVAHPLCKGCHKKSERDNAPKRCFECHDKSQRS